MIHEIHKEKSTISQRIQTDIKNTRYYCQRKNNKLKLH